MGDVTSTQSALNLLCSILRVDLLGGDGASLVVRTEDWPELMQAALRENFGALLFVAGRRRDLLANAPKEVANHLRMTYMLSLKRTSGQMTELRAALKGLADQGVRVAVLKGVALGALLYRDPVVRPMVDLDLLVPEASLSQAMAVLTGLGYETTTPFLGADFARMEEGELGFVKRSPPGAVVDLHWHVFTVPGYATDTLTAWFWDNTQEAMIVDVPVLVFGNEALLLHLSVHHYVHHTDRSLRRLLDVALLLYRHGDELNAELLWRGACSIGMGHVLERMLREVQDEWGVSTEALAEQLRRVDVDVRVAAKAQAGAGIDLLRSPLRHLAIGMSMADVRHGVRYVVRQIFPNVHYLRTRYGMRHDWQAPYYYVVRIGRGVRQLGGYLLRRLT